LEGLQEDDKDISDLVNLIDKLKDDLRHELAAKIDTDAFDRRTKKLVDETNILFGHIEEDKTAIK
jgi:hypothetical protein